MLQDNMISNIKKETNGSLVSIIIPVYNVEKYLKKCLDSVLSQTYSDWEAVVVDDGSTDNSGIFIDEYAKKDYRFKVIHQKNAGLSAARNSGLDIAQGEYIAFLDSDDWYESDYLQKMMDYSTPDTVICCGHRRVDDINKKTITEHTVNDLRKFDKKEFILFLLDGELKNNSLPNPLGNYVWNKLYPKELFKSVRFPVGKKVEDIFVAMDIFNNVDKYIMIPDILYNYRQRKGSIASRATDKDIRLNYVEGNIKQWHDLKGMPKAQKKSAQLIKRGLQWFYENSLLGNYSITQEDIENIVKLTENIITPSEHCNIWRCSTNKIVNHFQRRIDDVKSGLSFKIGRIITWIPRKLLGRK